MTNLSLLLHRMGRGLNLPHRLHLHRQQIKTLLLGASIIPVCCIHQLFSTTKMVDGFLLIEYKTLTCWYVYFLGDAVAWVIGSIIFLRLTKDRALRFFWKLFLSYSVFNLIMFFLNCNSVNYYYIPLIIIAIICNKVYS